MTDLLDALLLRDPALRAAGLLAWLALAAGLGFVLTWRSAAARLRDRVRARATAAQETAHDEARPPLLVRLAQKLLERRTRAAGQEGTPLTLKMWRAGFYGAAAPAWWILWRVVLVPMGMAVGVLITLAFAGEALSPRQGAATGALWGGLLGLVAPLVYRKNRADKRAAALRRGWPDLLELLALTIGAGLTLETALLRIRGMVSHKSPDLARELTVLVSELTYFGERPRALQNLNRRCDIPEADDLVIALIQAEKKGLPLGNLLTATAREQRRKRRMEIEKKAASLPAKLTVPMILFFLPALLIVILAPVVFRLGELF